MVNEQLAKRIRSMEKHALDMGILGRERMLVEKPDATLLLLDGIFEMLASLTLYTTREVFDEELAQSASQATQGGE